MSARVVIAYIVLVLTWGATWAAIKIGVAEVPPFLFAFVRAIAVGATLTVTTLVLRQRFPRGRRVLAAAAVAGVINTGGAWAIIFWAEQFVPSGVVAVFSATFPVWTAFLAHFFVRGDRLSIVKVVALALGLAGTAILVGVPSGGTGASALVAAILLALMPIAWAFAAILGARILSRDAPIPVIAVEAWAGAVFLIPFALSVAGEPASWSPQAILALAFLVIFGSCVALSLNLWLYRKLRPTTVSLSQTLTTAQALLIGGLFLGEALTLQMLLGAVLVVSAVVLNAIRGGGAVSEPVAAATTTS